MTTRHRSLLAFAALVLLALGPRRGAGDRRDVVPGGLLAIAFVALAVPLAWWGAMRRGACAAASARPGWLLVAGARGAAGGRGPACWAELAVVARDGARRWRWPARVFAVHPAACRRPPPRARPVLQPALRRRQGARSSTSPTRRARAGSSRSSCSPGDDLRARARARRATAPTRWRWPAATARRRSSRRSPPSAACPTPASRPAPATTSRSTSASTATTSSARSTPSSTAASGASTSPRSTAGSSSTTSRSGVYAEAVQREGYRDAKLRTLLDTVPDVLGPDGERADLRWTRPGRATSTRRRARSSSPTTPTGSARRSARAPGRASTRACSASRSLEARRRRGGARCGRAWRAVGGADVRGRRRRPVPGRHRRRGACCSTPPLRFRSARRVLRVRIARRAPGRLAVGGPARLPGGRRGPPGPHRGAGRPGEGVRAPGEDGPSSSPAPGAGRCCSSITSPPPRPRAMPRGAARLGAHRRTRRSGTGYTAGLLASGQLVAAVVLTEQGNTWAHRHPVVVGEPSWWPAPSWPTASPRRSRAQGFIAAFVAGMTFRPPRAGRHPGELTAFRQKELGRARVADPARAGRDGRGPRAGEGPPCGPLAGPGRPSIGAPRFELGTSPTRTVRATRLRHAPRRPSMTYPAAAATRGQPVPATALK